VDVDADQANAQDADEDSTQVNELDSVQESTQHADTAHEIELRVEHEIENAFDDIDLP
jgi:hypothetical protein